MLFGKKIKNNLFYNLWRSILSAFLLLPKATSDTFFEQLHHPILEWCVSAHCRKKFDSDFFCIFCIFALNIFLVFGNLLWAIGLF